MVCPEDWPTPRDVERTQESIFVGAPGGAEFGQTEVFQLTVRDHRRPRAIALTAAICTHVETHLQQFREKTGLVKKETVGSLIRNSQWRKRLNIIP